MNGWLWILLLLYLPIGINLSLRFVAGEFAGKQKKDDVILLGVFVLFGTLVWPVFLWLWLLGKLAKRCIDVAERRKGS